MPSHERIKQRREKLGLTKVQLAKRIKMYLPGIDDSDISKIERGRRKVRADELPYFALVLECDVLDLLDPLHIED